jgi:hypothetical protein
LPSHGAFELLLGMPESLAIRKLAWAPWRLVANFPLPTPERPSPSAAKAPVPRTPPLKVYPPAAAPAGSCTAETFIRTGARCRGWLRWSVLRFMLLRRTKGSDDRSRPRLQRRHPRACPEDLQRLGDRTGIAAAPQAPKSRILRTKQILGTSPRMTAGRVAPGGGGRHRP